MVVENQNLDLKMEIKERDLSQSLAMEGEVAG
jgi:hypothetical protein